MIILNPGTTWPPDAWPRSKSSQKNKGNHPQACFPSNVACYTLCGHSYRREDMICRPLLCHDRFDLDKQLRNASCSRSSARSLHGNSSGGQDYGRSPSASSSQTCPQPKLLMPGGLTHRSRRPHHDPDDEAYFPNFGDLLYDSLPVSTEPIHSIGHLCHVRSGHNHTDARQDACTQGSLTYHSVSW